MNKPKPTRYVVDYKPHYWVDYKAHYWHEYLLYVREMDKIEMNRRLTPSEYYKHRKAIINARCKTLQDKEAGK